MEKMALGKVDKREGLGRAGIMFYIALLTFVDCAFPTFCLSVLAYTLTQLFHNFPFILFNLISHPQAICQCSRKCNVGQLKVSQLMLTK